MQISQESLQNLIAQGKENKQFVAVRPVAFDMHAVIQEANLQAALLREAQAREKEEQRQNVIALFNSFVGKMIDHINNLVEKKAYTIIPSDGASKGKIQFGTGFSSDGSVMSEKTVWLLAGKLARRLGETEGWSGITVAVNESKRKRDPDEDSDATIPTYLIVVWVEERSSERTRVEWIKNSTSTGKPAKTIGDYETFSLEDLHANL